jgi:hypothetical protein
MPHEAQENCGGCTGSRPHPSTTAAAGATSTDFPRAVPVLFQRGGNDDWNNNLAVTTPSLC